MVRDVEVLESLPPVDRTLTWVVLLMRLLGWGWLVSLTVVALATDDPRPNRAVLVGAIAIATVGTGLTLLAVRRDFLGRAWYPVFDGVIALFLVSAGWLAGTGDFVAGGYPVSWLFIVAYASNLRWTLLAGVVATGLFAALHLVMRLTPTRVAGSMQLVVVALVVGWAFDALRQRERLRVRAEEERSQAQQELVTEQEKTTRLEERTEIARRLHDSVLQTLKLISASAEDASEVRYLARVQERDLRRTISEYQSPYEDSFRARLLDATAMVEDRYRIQVEHVIRADAEMNPLLQVLIEATTEAMVNAARHSGASTIDLFAEVGTDGVQVNVRDRGRGFDPESTATGGITHSVVEALAAVGGSAEVKTRTERGTEVSLYLPAQ